MGEQSFGRWKVTDVQAVQVPRKVVVEIKAVDDALTMTRDDGAVLGTWPVNHLRYDPYGRHNGFLDLAVGAAWITSVDKRPAEELETFLRERWEPLPPPVPAAPVEEGPTITRSYSAGDPAAAGRAFAQEAERLAARGYRPAAQFWADPDRSTATAIRVGGVLVALASLLFLPTPIITIFLLLFAGLLFYVGGASVVAGALTVTYERVADVAAGTPAPSVDPSGPPPVDDTTGPRQRLLELARLRDDGLITPDEYAARRAEIVATL